MSILSQDTRNMLRSNVLALFSKEKEHFAFYLKAKNNICVSSLGKIINMDTGTEYKQSKNANGYSMINIHHIDKGRRCLMAHRVIAETFYPYLGYDNYVYEVNHINGNKNDNSIENLEWLTRRENLDHARGLKLFKSGRTCFKIAKEDYKDVFDFYEDGCTIAEIGRLYNVEPVIIRRVINKMKGRNNE